MTLLPALAWLLLALPPGEQLSLPSLPKPVQAALALTPQAACANNLRPVEAHHFSTQDAALWVVRGPCTGGPSRVLLLRGKQAKQVGEARGRLIDATGEGFGEGLPAQLFFHVDGQPTEPRLPLQGGASAASQVPHRLRDPLTREAVSPAELREAALADLKAGSAIAAAGRLAILCDEGESTGCEVIDLEALAAADLIARLFPQAELALKRAIARPGHQAQDLQSLSGLLRAEGKNTEAAEVEARYAAEADAGL